MEQGSGPWDSKGGHTREAIYRHVLDARPPTAHLPPELRERILSFSAPEDVVFGIRLSCKEWGLCHRDPVYSTAHFSRPLPGHVVDTAWCLEGAQEAMQQLTLRQKLLTLSTAAASGCEANVDFAWQLLQPHVFPELLRTDHYRHIVRGVRPPETDLGSAAVASGLAHLLPSLAQRCPVLLNPARTLEAAARHCDLAGLQAAWEAVGQRLESFIPEGFAAAQSPWHRMTCAAASSESSDAIAKMDWVLDKAGLFNRQTVLRVDVCGAATASGDLARLAWLRGMRYPWGTAAVLASVVRHADLGFIQRLEQEGGYLPPAEEAGAWASDVVLCEAAGSPRDSAAKLLWLAGRGVALGSRKAMRAAAACGNVEAVQLLGGQLEQEPAGEAGEAAAILEAAVSSGSVPVAAWLPPDGYPWSHGCFEAAFRGGPGNLAMVRWLLQEGCPWGHLCIEDVISDWPADTPADSEALAEAVRLLVEAGVPAEQGTPVTCLAAAAQRQPSSALLALQELFPAAALDVSHCLQAAASGCGALLEALVGMGVCDKHRGSIEAVMYADAARNGDRGTLACLQRLGLPLGKGVLAAAIQQRAPVPALQWLVEQGAPRAGAEEAVLGVPYPLREEVEAWLQGLPGPSGDQ